MVNKQSRSEIRVKKHRRLRHHVQQALHSAHVYLCLEVIIIYTLRLSTILLVIHLQLLPQWKKAIKDELQYTDNVAAAAAGTAVAKKALEKGITEVVFDRGGFIYQGKIPGFS